LPKAQAGYASLLNHTVLIVGTGRESVALATRLLQDNPRKRLLALDGRDGQSASEWRERFGDQAPLWLVQSTDSVLPTECAGADIAVMSPGIASTSRLYGLVKSLGIPMTTSSALFIADHKNTMVGVTGSKGKSTTSALLHHLLVSSGVSTMLAGNMGVPVWAVEPEDFQVIELSSYQCHYLHSSPGIVVLTALFPEHLDWHGSEQAYFGDKLSLVAHQPGVVIANANDSLLKKELLSRFPNLDITWVGDGHEWHLEPDFSGGAWLSKGTDRLGHTQNLTLRGQHNWQNALLALAAASATGLLEKNQITPALNTFVPLQHRLQMMMDESGICFVNDSLATNPQATVEALRAFQDAPVMVLVGGADRGVDYQVLVDEVVAKPPKAIFGLPDSGRKLVEKIRVALDANGLGDRVVLEAVTGMHDAVARARALANPGDYVVLSPGAPSFGQYRDFAHRAEDFMAAITHTQEGTS
jgi:UDP-N-acetylmuramoyl-L-alanine---L-glutamate ligase